MEKTWAKLFMPYFEKGQYEFSMHIDDTYSRSHVARSLRNYFENHGLDKEYYVVSSASKRTVEVIKYGRG